ncbi:hypothetical protein ACROYT_G027201 [Oculina patagonica]
MMREFITVRDFLIARLGLENAQRPGPMETATVFYFRQAELSNDGSYTMYCPKHKRSFDGPARICMDAETHANVTTYIEYVRNIGRRITAFWKIASSATFDMDIVEKRAIHEHMAHKEATLVTSPRSLPKVTSY